MVFIPYEKVLSRPFHLIHTVGLPEMGLSPLIFQIYYISVVSG